MSAPPPLGSAVIPPSGRIAAPTLLPEPLPIRLIEPAPCTAACPAGINVKAYVSLIAESRFAEALEEVRRNCTLPSICGRICHAPCEAACLRAEHDDPLAIRALKRFVSDLAVDGSAEPADPPRHDERVAIVGSGPAGLTAAYDLRRAGFPVAILEAASEPGGMLRHGVADYRLPPDVLDAEIDTLLASGIELRTDTPILDYTEVTRLLSDGYSAVLLALGAQTGRLLGLDGEQETASVEDALSFLRRVSGGDRSPMSGKVIVIGGGSTAIEAARTALRLGAAPVEIVYRRSRAELPAGVEEIVQAEAEGITFRFLAAPHRIVHEDGSLQGVECHRVSLLEPDADGRPRPEPIPGSEFLVAADHVLAAVGQVADLGFITGPAAENLIERGLLRTDPVTTMTPQSGVFAAGDVVTGPTTVIEAIASGHEAATAIAHYLETGTPAGEQAEPIAATEFGLTDPDPGEAAQIRPAVSEIEAGSEFAEVEHAFTRDEAVAEASRCLRCGPCAECAVCAPSCDRRHLFMGLGNAEMPSTWLPLRVTADIALKLGTNGALPGRLIESSGSTTDADLGLLPMRMRYSADLCRGCARCIEVCQFDAFQRDSSAASDAPVLFDAAACRGCALCGAVCPTGALTAVAHSPQWWDTLQVTSDPAPTQMTLTCDTATSDSAATGDGETITCRCVGQVDPGMLLDLFRRGTEHLAVVPCSDCRYGKGPQLAAQHVAESMALLEALGQNGSSVRLATPTPERAS